MVLHLWHLYASVFGIQYYSADSTHVTVSNYLNRTSLEIVM